MRIPLLCLGTALSALGCTDGGRGGDAGAGDARLISDLYTWPCDAISGPDERLYAGVYGHTLSLEYAPGALRDLGVPAPGECAYGLNLFPSSAGSGGADIEIIGGGEPSWEMAYASDLLDRRSPGFWYDDVLETIHSCSDVEEHMTGGLTLRQAGSLSGSSPPDAAQAPLVQFSGYEAEIKWGDPVAAAWEGSEWDEVWVQLRREQGAGDALVALETVTCNVTGQTSFTADDAVWGQLDPLLAAQRTNLYVAFQNQDRAQTAAEETIDLLSRAIAAASLPD